MVKIEVYVRPSSLMEFHKVMTQAGIKGATMWETKGTGRDLSENIETKMFRGSELKAEYISRVRIETVVSDEDKSKIIHALQELIKSTTEDLGKLKIFVTPVLESYSL